MARPTKLTPVTQEAILVALRLGNTEPAAAAYAEIDYATLKRWKQRDALLRAAIEKAKADAQFAAVGRVRKAMGETWQAAAWWLERRYPADWGRVDRLELTLRQQAADLAQALGLSPELAARAEAEVPKLLSEYRQARKAQTG